MAQGAATIAEKMKTLLERTLQSVERALLQGDETPLPEGSTPTQAEELQRFASTKHAARGVLLTLAAYKAVEPAQDIRSFRTAHDGGFNARNFDTGVTVPFLRRHSLYSSVESHFLTRALAIGSPLEPGKDLTLAPKHMGPLLISIATQIQAASGNTEIVAKEIVAFLLANLIRERNLAKVALTKPKNLTIRQTTDLLRKHFGTRYTRNAPRLPQIAIYALYECLVASNPRYIGSALEPLARMKSADRKAGTIGDVVVTRNGIPVEAVETKLAIPVSTASVVEAIEKIRTRAIERYLVLSTGGISDSDQEEIVELIDKFRASNGCEIIANGVLETITYSLRLLPTVNEFTVRYADLVESDVDTDYEHRIAWNEICAEFAGP